MENTKYPRTYHLPFSLGATNDDKIVDSDWFDYLVGKDLVLTEKLDGQNTALMQSGVFARSHAQPTQNEWDKYLIEPNGLFDRIKSYIGENEIIYGENMFGIHSIEYDKLTDYFYVFNIRDDERWYSWNEVTEMCEILGLSQVPTLYVGSFNNPTELEDKIKELMKNGSTFGKTIEGVVVRVMEEFPLNEFKHNVIKFVRANHVQTDKHWTKNWKQAKIINTYGNSVYSSY